MCLLRSLNDKVRVGGLIFVGRVLLALSIIVQSAVLAKWVWPQALDFGGQLGGGKGELPTHSRGQIDHLDALPIQSDALEQLADVFDSSFGFEITFQVMTIAFQSACHHHAIGAVLKRAQSVQHIELACAGQLDDLDRRRILEAQTACQIGGGVSAIVACECHNLWAELFWHTLHSR
jgi:hypothetical protein